MSKVITFVTGNPNKRKEVVSILGGKDTEEGSVVSGYIIKNCDVEIEEIQGSIDEVTIHKAKAAANQIKGPVLVEDTCLAFNGLNDLPGPYIKWFLKGVGLRGLVDMLYKFEDKSAKAICTFGYCEGPGKEVKLFQGITLGLIVESRGHQNFGWDSIFEPQGFNQTYAEMNKDVKNSVSHRFSALDKFKKFLL